MSTPNQVTLNALHQEVVNPDNFSCRHFLLVCVKIEGMKERYLSMTMREACITVIGLVQTYKRQREVRTKIEIVLDNTSDVPDLRFMF